MVNNTMRRGLIVLTTAGGQVVFAGAERDRSFGRV